MHTYTKTAIAALTASVALALALTAATASARNFSVTEREGEVLWRELHFNAAGREIICPVTLLGHFAERTIPKIVGTRVGIIRHAEPLFGAEPSPCTGGTITILNETLPWNINYLGFRGQLPRIETIRRSLIGVSFRVTPRGETTCLTGTTTRDPAFSEAEVSGSRVTGVRADETIGIPLSGGFLCSLAGNGTLRGTGTVLNLPRNQSITITLI